jgi:hypothetical protein
VTNENTAVSIKGNRPIITGRLWSVKYENGVLLFDSGGG